MNRFPLPIFLLLLSSLSLASSSASNSSFTENFFVNWAPTNVKFLNDGQLLQLVLDNITGGAGFVSKESYLFGNIDMQIRLVPGDSAGTVTAYYLTSEGANHDELDFEFLGNVSGQPYILQTNVFSNGVGGREQRLYLWFDPTTAFHTYSVSWTKKRVVFLVDGVPIRVFSNNAAAGVPYLDSRPMRVYSSIWNGDSWATRGGIDKIDWTHQPFVASYSNFGDLGACKASTAEAAAACSASYHIDAGASSGGAGPDTGYSRSKLQWVKQTYMVYDYCTDTARYPQTPTECGRES